MSTNVFVTGGTMKPGAPSYIERKADGELYEAVLEAHYCSVLTTRQMGKSSLMARTAVRLRENGVACAMVDLQGKSDQGIERAQFYYGVLKQVRDGLAPEFDLNGWWKEQELLAPAQRFTDFFAALLGRMDGKAVVFIDEVDWMIRIPFSDEFFAAVRSCFNRRATEAAFERLTFVLLGSASPAQLIRDPTRTPFNIGRGIELTDFTAEEARPLAQWLGEGGAEALERVLYWTDGHPYLTQMLCAHVEPKLAAAGAGGLNTADLVDAVVHEKLLSPAARQEENNLKFVGERLTQATGDLRRVLRTYRDVLRGKPVMDVPASSVHVSLRLSGVVKADGERRLRVRNRVYEAVFDEKWVRERMPRDQRWKIAAAAAVLVAMVGGYFAGTYLDPNALKALQTASEDSEVAYQAYEKLGGVFDRGRAADELAQFFERRGDRDQAILVRARTGDRTGLAELIGEDNLRLRETLRQDGLLQFIPDGKLRAPGSDEKASRPREAVRQDRSIRDVTFSPDGKLVATGSDDNTARVWEVGSGREVLRLGHGDHVLSAAFSADGKLLVTGSADNTARVWEVGSGREVLRLGHGDHVLSAEFSADGKLLVTGSADNTARVSQVAGGREVARMAHPDNVTSVAFSADRKLVAMGGIDGIRIQMLAGGQEVSRIPRDVLPLSMAFSRDGKLLVTTTLDTTVRVWEVKGGREVAQMTHQNVVMTVAFSPDGKLVVTGSADRTARVWDVATRREVARLPHQSTVTSVAFSADGRLLATGSTDNAVRVWDMAVARKAAGARELAPLADQTLILCLAVSQDRRLMATGSIEGTAQVWDVARQRVVARIPNLDAVWGVAFSPDGNLLATASGDKTARIWEVMSGREMAQMAHLDSVMSVAFSADGNLVATGSNDSTARVWEVRNGREVARLAHGGSVLSVAFSADGKLVVTGSADRTARVMEVAYGHELSRLAHGDSVNSVAFSADGLYLVTQTGNWLHLYQRNGADWRPIGNRHVPAIWPDTVRFDQSADCKRCVEFGRDVPENQVKLERLNFDEHAPVPEEMAKKSPEELVKEWGAKLGLKFDARGRIVPVDARGGAVN